MDKTRNGVQTVDRRDALAVIISIVFGVVFQGLWYVAPGLLAIPLWPGSALTVSFVLAALSLIVPIIFAWHLVGTDAPATTQDTYETSGH